MNLTRNYPLLLPVVALLLCTACGKDRTGEYYNLTQEDHWIEEQMQNYYLWYYDMPVMEDKDYFDDPEDFFYDLLSTECRNGQGDTFSTFESTASSTDTSNSLSIDESSSYGFDFVMYRDPTGATARYMARVLYIIPDSPVDVAGLKRGDWIVEVGGSTMSSSDYSVLSSGSATTLSIADLVYTEDTGSLSWSETTDLNIEASRQVTNNPFHYQTVFSNYNNSGRDIGYLMYDRYTPGLNDSGTEYSEQMKQLFSEFKSAGVNEFILDLRYNMGGIMSCINELCSYLITPASLGQSLYSLEYNDKNTDLNTTTTTDAALAAQNLGLSTLYVITSSYTASASESTIYCLQPYMTVNLLGSTTVGKNVASVSIVSPYDFTIHPIVATVYNSQHLSDYESGIAPQYYYEELSAANRLGEIGDPASDMPLYYMLQWILNGSPNLSGNEAAARMSRSGGIMLTPTTIMTHRAAQGNMIVSR